MAAAHKLKASEKQALARKLTVVLKKEYKGGLPRDQRTVLDTLLFAICLENSPRVAAEAALARMGELFHDLNEVRVSSISELAEAFQSMDDPEWKALRVRGALQHVFERHFSFDFDQLRKRTLEQAAKQLEKIRDLSPFVRNHVLHEVLGAHVIPLDDAQRRVAVWLGLIAPDATAEHASEELKPAIRKADAPLFCHLLRCLATDERFAPTFQAIDDHAPEEGFDPATAADRLADLLAGKGGKSASRKSSNSKSTSSKSPRTSASAKKKGQRPAAARRKK
ncbi:MAG: hypothetical protein WD066_01125 [Planctomycetaceae bacterium]